ncbi:hypothetical protein [Paenibacillus jiagnxiensis]|uniref:hypothetical protein n=1 Tax=Paenibacillus jiagnxiensis TaxID=3228926 RepID=UPI0033A858F3
MKNTFRWNDLIARILLSLCAVGAFVSFFLNIGNATDADSSTLVIEIWRLYGFLVFTGLFVLLAIYPRRYAGIWELVIFHKAAVSITIPLMVTELTPDTQSVAVTDGILAIIVVVAYILAKGYSAWGNLRK